jgi:hypothetical protein
LHARIETIMSVPAGTGISVMVDPSMVVTGVDVVNTTSLRVLIDKWESVVSS